ncbi:hypothetical protein YW3DRAFT_07156 [Streptomyces sp. MnatMP-M77]|uniref:hypothetical protein n=1 Tax=unclassified Streptomyces TaxID=2593676 RepID=UPI000804A572|nr:hypothetical protein [Streptomyces sp. MnatMP-M77]SBV03916.1 hypothetical protein YW3DRAFT_07156 [Streptomyces sp. MnatMP-M77]
MLTKCLTLGMANKSCRDHYTPPEGGESSTDRLARVQEEYIEMLVGVHQAAPNAKVITIGYPAVLPDVASTCNRPAMTELGAGARTISSAVGVSSAGRRCTGRCRRSC